ncbi:MAG: LysM peptidoglycan-binding domain-containing protein [Proteobacteria bacterium]|nr:LysM peptidoglycan-binding domain-containing protein [Pseudomonadota bacterium]
MKPARIAAAACLAALLLGGCASTPPAPPPPVTVPPPPPPTTDANGNSTDIVTPEGAMPSAHMPSEWHVGNGEDFDDLFDRLRDGFALEEVEQPAVDQQLNWLVRNQEYLDRVFQRAQRYLYHIVCEVEARGMPLEFALLPVVESAYEPFAYSPSHAAGLWQFIPGTGDRFGLKQNWWYDGRRDVIESTRAALDYLQILHDQFNGDWLLAIAAYNVGERSVARAIEYNTAHGRPTDFWHLKLPAETRAYVPKLLAMKRIMAEPERYGLEFSAIPNEPYFGVIDTGSQIDLKIAAKLADSPYEDLVALNPGYNRWATDPAGPHRLLVPIERADSFEAALASLPSTDRVPYVTHEVAPHETLPGIAKLYGTSVVVLAKLNDVNGKRVHAGQVLRIPQNSGQLPDKVLLAAQRVDRPSTDVGGRRQIVHRVRRGETLRAIARRHRTSPETLARLNGIGVGERLIVGQRLVIKTSARRYRGETTADSRRMLYTVRPGDTLHAISRRWQVSVQQLKTWNGINKHHQIRAGQRLVMYVDANRRHS